jgi:cob(I)alamin adenosyltransferase
MDAFEQGQIQVYTGNCKGKTTAALGQAFRAMGHGSDIYRTIHKKSPLRRDTGIENGLRLYHTLEQYGLVCFYPNRQGVTDEDISAACKGLHTHGRLMLSGEYNIVVLDEVLTSCHLKLFPVEIFWNLYRKGRQY